MVAHEKIMKLLPLQMAYSEIYISRYKKNILFSTYKNVKPKRNRKSEINRKTRRTRRKTEIEIERI